MKGKVLHCILYNKQRSFNKDEMFGEVEKGDENTKIHPEWICFGFCETCQDVYFNKIS